jgi:hypothetical protein
MDSITNYVNSITSYQINIPIELQITIIMIIIIALCVGGYFLYDIFDITAMKSGFSWFIFIAVLNLITILVVFIYYNTKNGKYVGPIGKPGNKGIIGKKGTTVSCNLCKNNLYLEKVKTSKIICNLNTHNHLNGIFNLENYFNDIVEQGNSIDYDSFINNIILNKNLPSSNTKAIDNFRALMNINNISILLVKAINEYTKAAYIEISRFGIYNLNYGTFKRPFGISGPLPLGDSVTGGLETDMELNSFRISGNILYPYSYTNMVSFNLINENNETKTYTIWRPNPQTIKEPGFKGATETVNYKSLGDICREGTIQPNVNQSPTISEKCLDEIDIADIKLIFIYVSGIQKGANSTNQTHSYLITPNNEINNINIFSVWRTPLNTFLTNCNNQNNIVNNTVIFNIINNLSGSLNKYKNVKSSVKKRISTFLEQIQLPKIVIALILCYYYEIELIKDLAYYINKSRSTVPAFAATNIGASTLADLINLVEKTQKENDEYNKILIKNASAISLKDTKPYDESKERHLPTMLLNVYNDTITKLLTISVQIENTNTLLDIVNLVFENGIETRIAINSDGVIQGGILINSVQELVLRICKLLVPPNVSVYTIKDECLGTFAMDKERDKIISEFTDIRDMMLKLLENFISDNIDNQKYISIIPQIQMLAEINGSKVAQLCGHISNFDDKIASGDFEEITTSRIKSLIEIFKEGYNNIQGLMNSV